MSSSGGLVPPPSRDFVPAADLLFAPPKSRQKALPCKTARPRAGSLRCANSRGRAELAPLRSARTVIAESVLEACFARPLEFTHRRRFKRGDPKQPTPTARLRRSLDLNTPNSRAAPAALHSAVLMSTACSRALTGAKRRSLALVTSGRRERSGSRLAAQRSAVPMRSEAPWYSCAVQRLFFGDFLLAPQKKVTALPGAHPGNLSMSSTLHKQTNP
ncbi:hypothetical protein ABIC83_000737 [Roseateles asaccharophilus]|uniref:Uncharacterized protein n=1 Tax=Roseateles asaccharophilus TaxID=582607 RepID=A0ABU2A1T0_9BURK|nr:hypothetical protein [Roseateles asaccharophilus]